MKGCTLDQGGKGLGNISMLAIHSQSNGFLQRSLLDPTAERALILQGGGCQKYKGYII
jgi:hypothetical protein